MRKLLRVAGLVLVLSVLACGRERTGPSDDPDAGEAAGADASQATLDVGDAAVVAPSLDAGSTDAGGYYYPPLTGDTWETVSPSSLGWNQAALEDAIAFAGAHHSTGFIVLHRGRIVAERYWAGWTLHSNDVVASVAKSMTSFLIGLMREDGALSLDDRVTRLLGAGWSNAPAQQESAITVRHLLTMTSGLDESLGYVAPAGTRWVYNTPAYYVLGDLIDAQSGATRDRYTAQRLYSKIGMQDSQWRTKSMLCSTRDMARFGLMVLSQGAWAGTPVLRDTAYLAEALSTSQQLNLAYGYLWWLNGKSSSLSLGAAPTLTSGPLLPDAPADLVAALGAGDKKIYVVRSLDLVVVRHGDATGLDTFDNTLWQKLSAALPR